MYFLIMKIGREFGKSAPKKEYDIVIVRGGGHG